MFGWLSDWLNRCNFKSYHQDKLFLLLSGCNPGAGLFVFEYFYQGFVVGYKFVFK